MDKLRIATENISDMFEGIGEINNIIGVVTSVKTMTSNNVQKQYLEINVDKMELKCNAGWRGTVYPCKVGNKVKFSGRLEIWKKNFNISFVISSMEIMEKKDNTVVEHEKFKNDLIKRGMIGNVKRNISGFINKIGLVTSATGAVINDIRTVLQNNNFCGVVYVYNAMMQGDGCSVTVCAGVKYFNENPVDVIIIARGGGSVADILWFSKEDILNQVHSSNIPVISAIGHDHDKPLLNDVADYGVATPTAGATLIAKFQKDYLEKCGKITSKLDNMERQYAKIKNDFGNINYNKKLNEIALKTAKLKVNTLSLKYTDIMRNYEKCKERFITQVYNLKPRVHKNGIEIISANDIESAPKKLKLTFVDGEVDIYYRLT